MPRLDFSKELFKDDPAKALARKDFIPAEINAEPYVIQFGKHERRILLMAKEVEELIIDDDESNERAVAMGATASKANKELENIRKRITKPHREFIRTVNNACKMYTDKIQEMIVQPLKAKVGEYLAKKELAERKAKEQARKEAEKLQQKMNKEAAKAGIEAPEVAIPKVKDKPVGPVTTTPGTGYTRKDWTYEVVNLSKVPRKYLQLDKAAVNKAVKAGERNIPGIRIYQRSGVAFRTG